MFSIIYSKKNKLYLIFTATFPLFLLQNLISSSCIEHLDFLHLLSSDDLPNVEAFQQLEHASIGYQSLTDIPKAIVYNEPTYDFKVLDSSIYLVYYCLFSTFLLVGLWVIVLLISYFELG